MPTPNQMMDALRALSPDMVRRLQNSAYVDALERSPAWNTAKMADLVGAGAGAPSPDDSAVAGPDTPSADLELGKLLSSPR